MKNFKRNRNGGSVIFAIVMTMISLMVTSVMWFVLYPAVEGVANVITIPAGSSGAYFAEFLLNVWTFLGVIFVANILLWSFAYTVKRDWESQIG